MFDTITTTITFIIKFNFLFILIKHRNFIPIFLPNLRIPLLDLGHSLIQLQLNNLSADTDAIRWTIASIPWLAALGQGEAVPHALLVTVVVVSLEVSLHEFGVLLTHVEYTRVHGGTAREVVFRHALGFVGVLHEEGFMLGDVEEYENVDIWVFSCQDF